MSVFKNCLHPLIKVLKLSKAEATPKIDEFLHLLGISHLAQMYPAELSGGQQQRAAIARALCLGSDVLLLDEPTSALDPESRNALVNILSTLRSKGMTVVLSSHDVAFLKCVLDQVYFLENGMVAESYESATESLETKPKILQFMQS
jgi:ABC-type polar amino acid transport system ATPase subunit